MMDLLPDERIQARRLEVRNRGDAGGRNALGLAAISVLIAVVTLGACQTPTSPSPDAPPQPPAASTPDPSPPSDGGGTGTDTGTPTGDDGGTGTDTGTPTGDDGGTGTDTGTPTTGGTDPATLTVEGTVSEALPFSPDPVDVEWHGLEFDASGGVPGFGSIRFDAEEKSFAEIPGDAAINPGRGPFTVMIWVRTDSRVGTGRWSHRADLVVKGDPTRVGWGLSIQYDVAAFWLDHDPNRGGGKPVPAEVSHESKFEPGDFPIVNDGRWHHIVGTRNDAGEASLFVDGVRVAGPTRRGQNVNSTYPLVLGRHGTKDESYFDGQLTGFRYLPRGVTAEEVLAIYEEERPQLSD